MTLTSRTWSSLLGMTRTCMPVLELKTCPGGSACSRGIGKPLCSLLAAECTLPLLLMLLLSSWSSTCLSTDRLSFSIQLSATHTGSEVRPRPQTLYPQWGVASLPRQPSVQQHVSSGNPYRNLHTSPQRTELQSNA